MFYQHLYQLDAEYGSNSRVLADHIKISGMNDKQMSFVREYVIDSNATQAAIRAGYNPDTAYSVGSRLLKRDDVKTEIDLHRKRQETRADIKIDEIVIGLRSIAENPYATDSARVSALKALGAYKGMFDTNRSDTGIVDNAVKFLDILRLSDKQVTENNELKAEIKSLKQGKIIEHDPIKPPTPVPVVVDRSVVRASVDRGGVCCRIRR